MTSTSVSRISDSIILSNTFLCNFLFVFCFGWHHLHLRFLLQLFISTRQGFVFVFSNQVFQFHVEIMCFSFCLVNSECDAYLPVDHSLIYSHSKMFLLIFSLIFCAWSKTIFLDSYLGFFLSFVAGSSWLQNVNSVFNFPELVSLVFPFLIGNKCQPTATWAIDNYRPQLQLCPCQCKTNFH